MCFPVPRRVSHRASCAVSEANPRSGQLTAMDIGLFPLGAGLTAEPYIPPAWIAMTEPLAATCTTCSGSAWERNRDRGMFEYKSICIEQDAVQQQQAFISTRWGTASWPDTFIYVYNDDRSVERFDDFGNILCSDGSRPARINCGGTCTTAEDWCPAGSTFLSLSQARVPVPPGTGTVCYNVGIGADADTIRAMNVGLDIVLFPPGA